ncbi:methyl-accepting chemotaxis protein [Aquipuribacter nitratireducens]|uniref:Methyl-accepting chemotaxis protein n=1 Tax=Aquipuribacter nitratireducens TaxID=650104 RepID=A0ABW0GRT4_9MICO
MSFAQLLQNGFRPSTTQADINTALADAGNPLRATLDSLAGNCFIADLSLTLVYMNRRARSTVQELAGAVRQAFGMNLEQLLGGSIHRFHKDPARIDRILADPTQLPREAVFSFGGKTLRTSINSISDEQGTKLGYVVLWDDVSSRNEAATTAFDDVRGATDRIGTVSARLLEVAAETSGQADSAAAATEEMRAAVGSISQSSVHVSAQVRETMAATGEGVQRMEDLQRSSQEIGDFLRLITTVADQTKLLALNATIEAARAGEAGRGFAVVAEEVKQLAGTTSSSISDIESRIDAIQRAAQAAVTTLARISGLVDQINESQDTVAAAIEQQSAVTSEIAQAIAHIASGARETVEQSELIPQAAAEVTAEAATLHEIILKS